MKPEDDDFLSLLWTLDLLQRLFYAGLGLAGAILLFLFWRG